VLGATGDAALITALWLVALYAIAPATRLIKPALGFAGQAVLGSLAGLVAVSGLSLWAPWVNLSPARVLAMAVTVLAFSIGWEAVAARSTASRQRVLVVGAADGGAELVDDIALARDCPFEVIGFVDDGWTSARVGGVPRFGGLDDLPWVLDVQRPDLVVLAVSRNRPEAFASLVAGAETGFELLGLAEFHEQAFGRVPIQHLTPAWFMSVLHFYRRPYTRFSKRAFDVLVASFGLLVTAPLLPLVYVLVKRTPGPAIFRQTRLGEGGKHFTMLKFRTMRADAEAAGRPVWAEERDPRITTAGRFLRKTRLDELPQLWNVLRGDMSIVGPRPERPEFLEYLQRAVPFWMRRHMVKPGITGWAQVRRGYTSDADGTAQKLSYDLWYLRHRSLIVDLAICTRTASVLLTGSGSR
jgi:exopolysaccharide biosynthesis polyprenyl glycosylphosphotransferase